MARPFAGQVAVPGSKSATVRALVLAALADGASSLTGASTADDCRRMAAALRTLGAEIDQFGATTRVRGPLGTAPGERAVDCGLAGTVWRFCPALAVHVPGTTTFRLRGRPRPIAPLVAALVDLGADVRLDGGTLTVTGTPGLAGGRVVVDAARSSQFVSALLLSAPLWADGLEVVPAGPVPSRGHVAMTVAALRAHGVDVSGTGPWRVAPGPVAAADVRVPADLGAAVAFLAGAIATAGTVLVPGFAADDTLADAALAALGALGGAVRRDGDALVVAGGEPAPADLDLTDLGELLPVLAALAALARGTSRLRNVGQTAHHESDRPAALAAGLTALGARAVVDGDTLVVDSPGAARLTGGIWRAHADHRLAHAGAVLALRVPGLVVDDLACTSKTYPGFPAAWSAAASGASGR